MRYLIPLLLIPSLAWADDYTDLKAIFVAKEPVQIVVYEKEGGAITKSTELRVKRFNERTGGVVVTGLCNDHQEGVLRSDRLFLDGCGCKMQFRFTAPRTMAGPTGCKEFGPFAELLF